MHLRAIARKVLTVAIVVFSFSAAFALVGEDPGLLFFSISFLLPFSFARAFLRFKKRRNYVWVLALPVLLALSGFTIFTYEAPPVDIGDAKMAKVPHPSEKIMFDDNETGTIIWRLTSQGGRLFYYEPSLWNPDGRAVVFQTAAEDRGDEPPWSRDFYHEDLAVLDVENGSIDVYHTKYSVKWAEWSKDGKKIYALARWKDRMFEPYFLELDLQRETMKVMRLTSSDEIAKEALEKIPAQNWRVEGNLRYVPKFWGIQGDGRFTPEQAFFLHLNPSGTLAAYEAYDLIGVIDLEKWRKWIVSDEGGRAHWYSDDTLIVGGDLINYVSYLGEEYVWKLNVYTLQKEKMPLVKGAKSNHGSFIYKDAILHRVFVSGYLEKEDAAFIADTSGNIVKMLARGTDPLVLPTAWGTGFSFDGRFVLTTGPRGIYIFSTETGKHIHLTSVSIEAAGPAAQGNAHFSPDGRLVVFQSPGSNGKTDIYVAFIDASLLDRMK